MLKTLLGYAKTKYQRIFNTLAILTVFMVFSSFAEYNLDSNRAVHILIHNIYHEILLDFTIVRMNGNYECRQKAIHFASPF